MKMRIFILYFMIVTIPVFLAMLGWQSSRYAFLERDIQGNELRQEELIAENRRLISDIAVLSTPARIEFIAREQLGLVRKKPEEVLQILITGGEGL